MTIVEYVLQQATRSPAELVHEDTDLIVLLVSKITPMHHQVTMKTMLATVDINQISNRLSPQDKLSFPFLHTGCDTTSRPFRIGKSTALNKLPQLHEEARVFRDCESSKDDVVKLGNVALCKLYKIPLSSRLNVKQAARFANKVSTRSEYLPPGKDYYNL